MITAEEFFRNKIKEKNPNKEAITLSQELITAEEGMEWAHEFKQLYLHDVVGKSEELVCPECKSSNIEIRHKEQSFKCNDCKEGWAN